MLNCCILASIAQKLQNQCIKFSRVWTKNTICWGNFEKILKLFDENSIEKLNLYLFFGKFVAKNRNFGNNIIFLQQFFPVRGGGSNPQTPPPAYATGLKKFSKLRHRSRKTIMYAVS